MPIAVDSLPLFDYITWLNSMLLPLVNLKKNSNEALL